MMCDCLLSSDSSKSERSMEEVVVEKDKVPAGPDISFSRSGSDAYVFSTMSEQQPAGELTSTER